MTSHVTCNQSDTVDRATTLSPIPIPSIVYSRVPKLKDTRNKGSRLTPSRCFSNVILRQPFMPTL